MNSVYYSCNVFCKLEIISKYSNKKNIYSTTRVPHLKALVSVIHSGKHIKRKSKFTKGKVYIFFKRIKKLK